MNRLQGKIVAVQSSGHLSLVDVDVEGDTFTSIVVETAETAPYLAPGNAVLILFKETEVSLAKNLSGSISLRNRMHSVIRSIDQGALLSAVTLDFKGKQIVSVITTRSVERLALRPGDEVEGLVKANELTLMEPSHEL